ncbi:MAG: S1C family serine protease [Alphaproteobacteria bacterium]|jgi:S1-C subfamily serine protease|nr:S1C family serine protease [Alphaproteobacteria bacterium]
MKVRLLLAIVIGLAGTAPLCAAEVGEVLDAVVIVDAEIPGEARTARFLGTERSANGIVIDDNGLILTIGYIILEAMSASVTDASGKTVPAEVIAYDYDTGFGLLRALAPISAKPLRFGNSAKAGQNVRALVVAAGGPDQVLPVRVTKRAVFAGYWEYLLEDAIFTTPRHPAWAGAALIDAEGRLLGVGSLQVNDAATTPTALNGNLFVPIDLLKPILGDLLENGRSADPPRPWLGLFTRDMGGHVIVTFVIEDGPGAAAGVSEGSVITEVAGEKIKNMADMFRKVWALGEAGVPIALTVDDGDGPREVIVESADRYDYLRLDPSY